MPKQRGLTLLEIVIVVAIMAIIAYLILTSFVDYRRVEALRSDARLVALVLQEARTKTISGEGDNVYGVHFDIDQVVLFTGLNYSAASPTNATSALSSLIRLSTSSIDVHQITFSKLSGTPSQSGDVILYLNSDPTASTTVNINSLGVVSLP